MKHKKWMTDGRGIVALLLLTGGLMLVGCESDPVAPQDELPQLTEQEAAQQAAIVAVGLAKVGPELLKFSGLKAGPAELGIYPYEFPSGGDITGSIMLEYFDGGPGGTHSHWNDADYGLLYSPSGEVVTLALDLGFGFEVSVDLTFDLAGPIDRAADTATVTGSGTLASGDETTGFTISETDPVVLSGLSAYPSGGTLLFTIDGIQLEVSYDGDDTAAVTIADVVTFMIDLDTGIVTPVT
ncbi:MAG: hypothetical protein KAH56_06550 [Candidatus Krumholzibacteria bacterium]|nr:hypothetical protein [Candidatus Krumholzibacteria bacterium]